ncbi:MAG: phosphoribosylanthranilate isomerase [Cyanobium sp.]
MTRPTLKICGLRKPDQALAIAALGVEAIGVIGVEGSPRYLAPEPRRVLFQRLAEAFPACRRVLVVADPSDEHLGQLGIQGGHDILQLHGDEDPGRCLDLKHSLGLEVWKALRIRSKEDLGRADLYLQGADALLMDAWTADQLGGTGKRLPLDWLQGFRPERPWWLAGGLTPEAIPEVLQRLEPDGLDVSSGVEDAPGEKNLKRGEALMAALRRSGGTPAA